MRPPEPVVLESDAVRLEPLTDAHAAALTAAVGDDGDEVFRWMGWWLLGGGTRAPLQTVASMGCELTWVVVRRRTDEVVGSSSYLDVSVPHRRLEIGATWLARPAWRTEANSATKLLLMGYAFDDLGAERVAFKTDLENVRSQRALERLGAVREGVLRHHLLRPDGTWRDSVHYSVLHDEWSSVRARLLRGAA